MCPMKWLSSEKNDLDPVANPGIEKEKSAPTFPFTVGIGASAGGHEPLEHIFLAIPADCDLSFVVVMHLPPDGPPLLADIIKRYTTMEVLTVENGMSLRPNTVHVIPPGKELTVSDGRLQLHDPDEWKGRPRHPVDRFFTSLAADFGERAIAVVLSGSGSDGSRGVKHVKERGGLVIVQEPKTAINPDMPQNAISTGVADIILPAEEIADKLAEIVRGECHLPRQACMTTTFDEELQALFTLLKDRTGHDFSSYKRNTVLRRIERRMAVNEAGGLRKYLAILEENPQEAQTLCEDFLIGVTRFFRDPEAFELLRSEIIPNLFANRDPQDPIRIWHACCASGEEVYSVAMLILEYLEKENLQTKVQIFATDIDEVAVAQARAGLYPADIAPEVGKERLKNFFIKNESRWQVTKQLREMIVFAHHSLIKDPPFSRLDLLVCRNFLIYLNPDIQKRLIQLFHQVLKPGGFLFLGSAETVGLHSDLFASVDKKWKIFARQKGERRVDTIFPFSGPIRRFAGGKPSVHPTEPLESSPIALAEKLLTERYVPVRVIVNEKNEVIHFSNNAGTYLLPPEGEPTRDLLRMAREELRPALRVAIYKTFADQQEVIFRGIKVRAEAGELCVNIVVIPLNVPPPASKLALVVFEPAPPLTALPAASLAEGKADEETSRDSLVRQLEEQLRVTDEQLQATSEQLETSNEGFMSANEELMTVNEELQSTNEELQSTNEELETSKEELQALNEELVTVNFQLQSKVEDLNLATTNLENLLDSSEIATLFLDRNLNIKGFTPAAATVFHLIQTDTGRPFRHFAGKIDWPTFSHDAELVLEGRPFAEQEVTTLDEKRCYLKRIFPYKTAEGKVDGIVVTLIDITERKLAEGEIIRAKEAWERTFDSVPDLIAILDNHHRVLRVNQAMARRLGVKPEECIGLHCYEAVHGTSCPPAFCPHSRTIGDGCEHFEEVTEERLGGNFLVTTTPLLDENGERIGSVHIAHDITERKRAEEKIHLQVQELRMSNEELIRFNRASVGRELRMIELKKEVNTFCETTGKPQRYPLEFEEN